MIPIESSLNLAAGNGSSIDVVATTSTPSRIVKQSLIPNYTILHATLVSWLCSFVSTGSIIIIYTTSNPPIDNPDCTSAPGLHMILGAIIDTGCSFAVHCGLNWWLSEIMSKLILQESRWNKTTSTDGLHRCTMENRHTNMDVLECEDGIPLLTKHACDCETNLEHYTSQEVSKNLLITGIRLALVFGRLWNLFYTRHAWINGQDKSLPFYWTMMIVLGMMEMITAIAVIFIGWSINMSSKNIIRHLHLTEIDR